MSAGGERRRPRDFFADAPAHGRPRRRPRLRDAAPRDRIGVSKPAIAPLTGDRVRLRLLEEADLDMTRRWRNQPSVRKWFLRSNEIAPEQHRAWFTQYRERADDFMFVIEQ